MWDVNISLYNIEHTDWRFDLAISVKSVYGFELLNNAFISSTVMTSKFAVILGKFDCFLKMRLIFDYYCCFKNYFIINWDVVKTPQRN